MSRDGNVIYSLVDPTAAEEPGEDGEVPPLLALCDLLEEGSMGQGSDGELTDNELWVEGVCGGEAGRPARVGVSMRLRTCARQGAAACVAWWAWGPSFGWTVLLD